MCKLELLAHLPKKIVRKVFYMFRNALSYMIFFEKFMNDNFFVVFEEASALKMLYIQIHDLFVVCNMSWVVAI